jgi:hypothetical protein
MSLQTKATLINGILLVALLAWLYRYPLYIIAISAAILFPVANLGLLLKARKMRHKSTPD